MAAVIVRLVRLDVAVRRLYRVALHEGFGRDGFLLGLPSNGSDAADEAMQPNVLGNGNGFDQEYAELAVPNGLSPVAGHRPAAERRRGTG